MGGIDHQMIGLAALRSELGKDAVDHTQAAPADKAVVDRFVRTMCGRRIASAQPVPDHEDDAAHDPTVIDLRDAVRQWEIGLDPAHLCHTQHPDFSQRERPLSTALNQPKTACARHLMGSEPSFALARKN